MNTETKLLSTAISRGEIKTRTEAAKRYAEVILVAHMTGDYDVGNLNQNIVKRWSQSGLKYIKRLAWNMVEAR